MKHVLLPFSVICFLVSASLGQMAFKNNQNVASIGLGIGYISDLNIPPIIFTLEHGVTNDISLGGIIGYTGASDYWDGHSGYYSYSNILIGMRGSYHFDMLHDQKFDTYAGLMLGYDAAWHYNDFGESYRGPRVNNSLELGLHAGGRYYFSPVVAFQLELGFNELYILSAGLCFKL